MPFALKDYISFASLAVSAVAMATSYMANQQAQNLDELIFRAETVHHLLKEVHDNTTKAGGEKERAASCLYAGALARAEELVVSDIDDRLVGKLFLDQVERGLLPQNCIFITLEQLTAKDNETAPDNAATEVNLAGTVQEIGKFHALIASYPAISSQCDNAKDDVKEFAALLANNGLDGRAIYVARTVKSNSYAVTVDLGDDRALAHKVRNLIRNVSSQSSDKKTGHDSFVQVNSDWFIDPNCSKSALFVN